MKVLPFRPKQFVNKPINEDNLLLMSDSYKYSQWRQYPLGTTIVRSYIESRGGEWDQTVYFGLQGFIFKYLMKGFTQADINEAEEVMKLHGVPFNRAGWESMLAKYGGDFPVKIKALPEGTIIDGRQVLLVIENTDPEFYWLTNFLETALLRAIWYPTTVATNSFESKKIIMDALIETGTPELIAYKLNDFGARGVSSHESAQIGGTAHLVNFRGSDTVEAIAWARNNYDALMPSNSIPAMEHSTVTSWERYNETKSYRNMIEVYGQDFDLLAMVMDSYDFEAALRKLGTELKQLVLDSKAMIVCRPDSGVPHEQVLLALRVLDEYFGSDVNEKGYKVLRNVRVIQGDGIDQDSIRSILNVATLNGFSADNIAFGQGGALLQGVDRDTMKFAMKCSAIQQNGKWVDVYKDPVTDRGKVSKKGRVSLFQTEEGEFVSLREEDVAEGYTEALVTMFDTGEVDNITNFDEVCARANAYFTTEEPVLEAA